MASPAKKAKLADKLPVCLYGAKCYRKNPQHFKTFLHEDESDGDDGGSSSKATKPALKTTSSGSYDDITKRIQGIDTSKLPPCKYGEKCFRKNLLHFAEFSHPVAVKQTAEALQKATDEIKDNSGSDTDTVESDDEGKQQSMDAYLNRGMSLMKEFTAMSETERRQLIEKALKAKVAMQAELRVTKKEMKEKDKKLVALQEQVNTGTLVMEGERAALEGDKIVYFPLQAERAYKENSAAQIHFRLAESQFYRLMSGDEDRADDSYRVTQVEYVVNPTLVKRFRKARADVEKVRGKELSYPVLAFHGTDEASIVPICETGFRVPGESGFEHKTDTGWYGKGVYFSEWPGYSMDYISDAEKLLLCQVLPAKTYRCKKLIHGQPLMSDFDSHMSPDEKELVIFNAHHILPQYVVHYTCVTDGFTYKDRGEPREIPDSEKMAELCAQAKAKKKTKVFQGKTFQFSGTFQETQKKMGQMVGVHGGSVGTKAKFDILVTCQSEFNAKTAKVTNAQGKKGCKIVSEDFVYDCIIEGEALDGAAYAFR